MKIYVMTDLEGVAGVLDSVNWCERDSRYYDRAKGLLTGEVNAAVKGLFDAGADEIVVLDGHGWGGIDLGRLDPRVQLITPCLSGFPFLLDETSDFQVFVGQHAKAGTPFAHMAHTGNMGVLDFSINGISLGEFGKQVLCASQMGIRTIFASGDRALALEAEALVSGIETVAVKRGVVPGTGDELDADGYLARNEAAVHLHPERARRLIRKGARRALERATSGDFGLARIDPPWHAERRYRRSGRHPLGAVARAGASDNLAGLLNTVLHTTPEPIDE